MSTLGPGWPKPIRLALAFVAAAWGACSDDRPTASAQSRSLPTVQEIVLSDPEGAPLATLRVEPRRDRCEVELAGAPSIAFERHGDRVEASGDAALGLGPAGPSGAQIVDTAGAPSARVVHSAPSRIDILDMQGIAKVRIRIGAATDGPSAGAATLLDRASIPTATVALQGGRFIAASRDGTVLGYVLGTDDVSIAALLSSFDVELPQRVLLACDRLLAPSAPAPAPVSP